MSAHPFPFWCTTIIHLLALCALLIAKRSVAAPGVSNLIAAQRVGPKLADVRYDLVAPGSPTLGVSLHISRHGGATGTAPVTSMSGAIGINVAFGTVKVIAWNAGADWPSGASTQMRFRADEDDGCPFIPADNFTMGRPSGDMDSNALRVLVRDSCRYALWPEFILAGHSNPEHL